MLVLLAKTDSLLVLIALLAVALSAVALLVCLLKIRKKAQKESSEGKLLHILMDNIPYTIYFKDRSCRFTLVNENQARLLGLKSAQEAIGKSDFDFFPHASQAYHDEQEIMRTGTPLIDKVERIKNAEGKYIWVSTSKIAIRNDKGKITGIVGITRDITQRKIEEQRLREAKERAERSDKLKSTFLANMSHEIRTPMNAIIGFSDMLDDQTLPPSQRHIFLNYIRSSGQLLLRLIDDIIDVAKIEAGELKINLDQCHINQTIDELAAGFRKQIQQQNKQVKLRTQKSHQGELCIETDTFRLRQIISNLINNALKFTEKGYIEVGYTLLEDDSHLQNQDNKTDFIRFHVKDTGVGMPQDKLNIIFDRFGQIEDIYKKNQRGTGLGLAISKNLTTLLGGEIWVESELGKGSAFFFTLPLKMKQTKTKNGNNFLSMETHDWKNKVILVAEDVAINYKLIEVALRKTYAKILWAKDGKKAVELCKTNPEIDLVLMDIQMPEMDGYEATREIKKIRSNLPVIAQTAFAMADEEASSLSAGCDSYITKPINKAQLIAAIGKYLDRETQTQADEETKPDEKTK